MRTKGLSILIPVYQWDVRPLVFVLHQQALELQIPYEIVCMDDASDEKYHELNLLLEGLPHVKYKRLDQNVGRSHIRNLLAQKAMFEYLLFLDCDSGVGDNFLKLYERAVKKNPDNVVIVGQREYPSTNQNSEQELHWKYGKMRESRSQKRSGVFCSNNFLTPATLFSQIKFDESIRNYGHEDTIFGLELKKRGIKIHKTKAKVYHLDLKDNQDFIVCSKDAVANLHSLLRKGDTDIERVSLIKAFKWMQKLRLTGLLAKRFVKEHKAMEQELSASNPSLALFDKYKLRYLCYLHHKKNQQRHL